MSAAFPGHPLFDTPEHLPNQIERPWDYPSLQTFMAKLPPRCHDDWEAGAQFLMRHTTTTGTYSQFRGEVQRFLNFLWLRREKTLSQAGGDDIDQYMALVKKPLLSWATPKAAGRQRGFVTRQGVRVANPKWRPFYDAETRRKDATMSVVVASLNIFFTKLVVSGYLPKSPMIESTRKAQKASKSEHSGNQKGLGTIRKKRTTAPRLTTFQWSYVHDSVMAAANEDSRYERNLFVIVTMKALYLRVFELAAHGSEDSDDYVEPVMGDFGRTTVGNRNYWDLHVCGKGGKNRWIPLPAS
jgi:hypothetical protein